MNRYESLDVPFASLSVISGTTSPKTSLTALSEGNGNITISQAINAYMACYQGNDKSLAQRIACWQVKLGTLPLNEVDEDHIFFAIEELSNNSYKPQDLLMNLSFFVFDSFIAPNVVVTDTLAFLRACFHLSSWL
ncbi:hypothetical protein [Polynucleobacter necessarius]|uniref:hypothetical protein n=1 Tax=Polynucleobacter necessarius TaxID=576610 RepID=UPI001E3FA206|nr:hypothetical protein [Polynucleobacter necessarius]